MRPRKGAQGPHMPNICTATFLKLGGTNNVLVSGSNDNYRVEISGVNNARGTFNVLVRSGQHTSKRKNVLESFNNVSMDPNSSNYIARIIGNQDLSINGTTAEPYIKPVGEFPNKSKFVRVKTVHSSTPNYLNEKFKLPVLEMKSYPYHQLTKRLEVVHQSRPWN